jgi:NAD(P)H dehydrogenase (quinone)
MTRRVHVVYAHPCDDSYAAALKNTVTVTLTKAGWDVDLCDLYAEGFDPIMSATERRGYHNTATNTLPVQGYVDRLRAAQALVFVNPVWNFGPPAILKGYYDRVFVPGVSFKLENGQITPAMTHIRKLGVITTYGASWFRATLAGNPPRKVFTRAFWYTAKPDKLLYLALYDMNRADQAKRAGYVARVQRAMEQF